MKEIIHEQGQSPAVVYYFPEWEDVSRILPYGLKKADIELFFIPQQLLEQRLRSDLTEQPLGGKLTAVESLAMVVLDEWMQRNNQHDYPCVHIIDN